MAMYKGPIPERRVDGPAKRLQQEEQLQQRQEERLGQIGALLLPWYKDHARDLPWRRDADPYRVWISEIMLQQTRVDAVKPYYGRFMAKLPDVAALAQMDEDVLLKLWEGLGYYSRARNLKKAAMQMMEQHGGRVPSSFEELLKLPGIGRYTAGAVASIAYKVPVPAVDGNVLRVISRVLASFKDIALPQTRTWMEGLLKKTMDQEQPGLFNQGLFEVGALVCTRSPDCGACPLAAVCAASKKDLCREIPVKSGKKARRIEERTVLVVRGRGTARPGTAGETEDPNPAGTADGREEVMEVVALKKRPPKGLLASLYEFPNIEGKLSLAPESVAARALLSQIIGVAEERVGKIRLLGEAEHVFSHVEWHMVGYEVWVEGSLPPTFIWADICKLEGKYPLPSAFLAYRKALSKVK